MFGKTKRLSNVDPRVLQVTTMVAAIVAVLIAVMAPVSHFYFGYQYEKGSVIAEAESGSRAVTQIIGRNPTMWQFETLRIDEILHGHGHSHVERWRVLDTEGTRVTEVGEASVPWPVLGLSFPVFDAGIEAGRLEVARSLRAPLWRSFGVFLFSSLLGGLIFLTLRTLPLNVLRKAIDRASYLASHDPLTHLPNRSLFNDWLTNAIANASRHGEPLAALCLDLDHFKDVNDILGHAAGDELLRQVTERIRGVLHSKDFLARLGGDELAIVQTSGDQPGSATHLANRIILELTKPFDLDGNETLTGVSIGITIFDGDETIDASRLLQQADLALYRAKSECRGSIQFYAEEMNQQLLVRKQLEVDLRRAISSGELELNFQPQIDLTTNRIVGVEALLRWNHPTQGRIPPDQFIGLAEETGLILPIGEWVLRKACAQAHDWPDLKFAVNVSPVQFRQGDLVETIRDALETEGIEPSRLEIEITEGILLHNTDETIAILNQLKGMGVRIAMDDFGTGYSSLNYLRRFDFDKIKIDRSFISGLGHSTEADCIIQAVIDLGASLGMTSNAEGVETIEQARILKQQGCEEVQGYYFGKPMTSTDIKELLLDEEMLITAAKGSQKTQADNKIERVPNSRTGSDRV